jgi:hypothetical protein
VKVALTLLLQSVPEELDAYLEFHRRAGVDVVLVGGPGVSAAAAAVLDQHARDGFVRRMETAASQTELARVAAGELGADWVIPSTVEELWWPRGESLKDVLAVIPQRYGVVQALVRTFGPNAEHPGQAAFEARVVRTSLLGPDGSGGAPLDQLLRPVYRASASMTLDPEDWTLGGRRVPLRAWYPIEVFHYPANRSDPLSQRELDARLAEGTLVVDTRLRDALGAEDAWDFRVPSVVDDASHAIECAAVGEVDLVRLDRQIRDLELRIAELEAEFWPRFRSTVRRLARRRR